jgi:hypothetical protein
VKGSSHDEYSRITRNEVIHVLSLTFVGYWTVDTLIMNTKSDFFFTPRKQNRFPESNIVMIISVHMKENAAEDGET